MKKEAAKKLKLVAIIAIVALFVWFLVVSPMVTFHNNEKKLEDAAKHYYELNSNALPTGERVKTLTLSELYHQSYIKGDIYIPYTQKTCSIENSWVKVRKENGEYKYYTYLECGILSSTVDHKGPEIKLSGDKEIVLDVGEEFKDPGVSSVVDNVDGKMKVTDVSVTSDVDTSKVGTYTITYTAYDDLKNKTVVERNVVVVRKLYGTIKEKLGKSTNFVGEPEDNYVLLSNILFRVYGIDKNKNIILVAAEDIANVNFTKVDKWLDYFYDNLNENAQKMIVENKYCNMNVTETTLDTTQCSSYTKDIKVYIPSIVDINKASAGNENFMYPYTMSWTADAKDKKEAYVVRNVFFDELAGRHYVAYDAKHNYGVRPMLTIKGDSLITGGSGLEIDPYIFGDTTKAKGGTLLNDRYTGEYVLINNELFRIVKTEKDGTTRVISQNTIGSVDDDLFTQANPSDDEIIYNPKEKLSVGYFINNQVSRYLDTSYFVSHEIEVPYYKNNLIYGEEYKTETYKVKLSAPNMYEMFSAQPQNSFCSSYWLINTVTGRRTTGAISYVGVPLNQDFENPYMNLNIRVVAYVKKGTVISGGNGTFESPYTVR